MNYESHFKNTNFKSEDHNFYKFLYYCDHAKNSLTAKIKYTWEDA